MSHFIQLFSTGTQAKLEHVPLSKYKTGCQVQYKEDERGKKTTHIKAKLCQMEQGTINQCLRVRSQSLQQKKRISPL